MSLANTRDLVTERAQAVAEAREDVRSLLAAEGINRASLESVKQRLIALSKHQELFSSKDFPVKPDDGSSSIYLLGEDDEDHGFALYLVAENTGNMSPPHDHTTWAVIVGVQGEEVNRFYDRTDDGSVPGKGTVVENGQGVVKAGTGVAFLGDDIHSIHCFTDELTLNFHMYGRSIEHLPERKMFNMRDGTYKHFPPNPHIYK